MRKLKEQPMSWLSNVASGIVRVAANRDQLNSLAGAALDAFQRSQSQPKTASGSKVVEIDTSRFTRLPEQQTRHFGVFQNQNGSGPFRIVFEEVQKQVLEVLDRGEALYIARGLDRLVELAKEAHQKSVLNKLVDLVVEHQHWTDFHYACAIGCPGHIERLLRSDAGVGYVNLPAEGSGELPLHLALMHKHFDVARTLIRHGASAVAANLDGGTAFHVAAAHSTDFLKALMEAAPNTVQALCSPDVNGHVPMATAAAAGNLESVRVIAVKLGLAGFQEQMRAGYAPLHAPLDEKHRTAVAEAVLESLPALVELANAAGTTPLAANVAKKNVDMVLVLIAHGADFNKPSADGKPPLILAVEAEHVSLVKLFLALGAQSDAGALKNAMEFMQPTARRQVQALIEQGRSSAPISPALPLELAQVRLLKKALENPNQGGLRLLALDGGGIKGLITVVVLHAIENGLRRKLNRPNLHIADYFDWFAGTSTGAIIALALVSGRTTTDILRLYLRFRGQVFAGSKPYDSQRLERVLMKEFGRDLTLQNVAGTSGRRVLVTTTCATSNPPELVLMRNYEVFGEKAALNVPVWLAARRSSAAPYFFEPSERMFLDGGLMANNPCSDLLVDVNKCSEHALSLGKEPPRVAVVVSVGTGRPPSKQTDPSGLVLPKGLADVILNGFAQVNNLVALTRMFVDQICSSDGPVAQRAQVLSHALQAPFFRLSPALQNDVDLDASDDFTVIELLWTASVFCRRDAVHEIGDLVTLLAKRELESSA